MTPVKSSDGHWDPGANRLYVEVGLVKFSPNLIFIEPKRLRQRTVILLQVSDY